MVNFNFLILDIPVVQQNDLGVHATNYRKMQIIEERLNKFPFADWCRNPEFKRRWKLLKDKFDKYKTRLTDLGLTSRPAAEQVGRLDAVLKFQASFLSVQRIPISLSPFRTTLDDAELRAVGEDFIAVHHKLHETIAQLNQIVKNYLEIKSVRNTSKEEEGLVRKGIYESAASINDHESKLDKKVTILKDEICKQKLTMELGQIANLKREAMFAFSSIEREFTDDDLIDFMEKSFKNLNHADIERLIQIVLKMSKDIKLESIDWQEENVTKENRKFTCACMGIILSLVVNSKVQRDDYSAFKKCLASISKTDAEKLRQCLAETSKYFDKDGTVDDYQQAVSLLRDGKGDLTEELIIYAKKVHSLYFPEDSQDSDSEKEMIKKSAKRRPTLPPSSPPPPPRPDRLKRTKKHNSIVLQCVGKSNGKVGLKVGLKGTKDTDESKVNTTASKPLPPPGRKASHNSKPEFMNQASANSVLAKFKGNADMVQRLDPTKGEEFYKSRNNGRHNSNADKGQK